MAGIVARGYLLGIPVDFPIAVTRIRFSHHVLVQVRSGDVTGVGEGVLYHTLPHRLDGLFRQFVQPAREKDPSLPQAARAQRDVWLGELAAACPSLAYAVDSALWDWQGKVLDKRTVDLLGGPCREEVPITEQVFIRDWPTAEAELAAILSRGTRRLKVKIGTTPRADLEAVRRVRAFVGPGVEVRVDANRAYPAATGEPLYKALADEGVLALEEPLAGRDWAGLRALRQSVGLPVILDENVQSLHDLETAIANEAIDVLNVKLTRLGGITQALRYVQICRHHGIETAIGCSEDLGVGTAAIVHLAAALPQLHSTEGVGPLRLGFDVVAEPWQVRDGALALPKGAGLGVTLAREWRSQLPAGVHRFELPGGWRLRAFSHYARWFQRANTLMWRMHRKRA